MLQQMGRKFSHHLGYNMCIIFIHVALVACSTVVHIFAKMVNIMKRVNGSVTRKLSLCIVMLNLLETGV